MRLAPNQGESKDCIVRDYSKHRELAEFGFSSSTDGLQMYRIRGTRCIRVDEYCADRPLLIETWCR